MSDILVDSSAVVAILREEPEAARLLAALGNAHSRAMSVFNVLATSVVLRRVYGDASEPLLDQFLRTAKVTPLPMDLEQLALARDAWGRYGRSRHPARLNLGDCCAYGAAKASRRPLLCKGDDFPQTDLELVPW